MEIRRLILAVALSLLALMVWTRVSDFLWGPIPKPKPSRSQPVSTLPSAQPAPPGRPAGEGEPETLSIEQVGSRNDRILIGDTKKDSGFEALVHLSTRGAGVREVNLGRYAERVAEPDQPYRLLKPVEYPDHLRYSLATEYVVLYTEAGERFKINLDEKDWSYQVEQGNNPQAVRFWVDISRAGRKVLRVEKRYVLEKGTRDLKLQIRFENLADQQVNVVLCQRGPLGVGREDPRSDSYRKSFAGSVRSGDEQVTINKVGRGRHVLKSQDLAYRLIASNEQIIWAGQTNKYFAAILAICDTGADLIGTVEAKSYSRNADLSDDLTTIWVTRKIPLAGSGRAGLDFELYMGPKSTEVFDQEPYRHRSYSGTLEFSWCTIQWLANTMIYLLKGLQKICFGSYGLAIIIMVVLVRLIMHPITKSSQASMFRMQRDMRRLQPKMTALKEKYKANKQALNKAIMDLYKQEGINPASQMLGCLPMALQMPIWVALWTALNNTFELRHEPFIWPIYDLAGPDAIITFARSFKIPFLSGMTGPIHSLNILPILLGISMQIQQRFTPQAGASDPAQAKQQKIMFYFMSVFFTLVLYNAPSGLNLYILTSNIIGFLENRRIRRHMEEQPAAPAQKKSRKPGRWEQWRKKLESIAKDYEAKSAKSAKRGKHK